MSMPEKPPLFALPSAPVDGFEFTVWVVDTSDFGGHLVQPTRFIYRVHRKWCEEFPNDEDPRGAAIEDAWAVYGPRFARGPQGWRGVESLFANREHHLFHWAFASAEEALTAARKRLRERVDMRRQQADEIERRLVLGVAPRPLTGAE